MWQENDMPIRGAYAVIWRKNPRCTDLWRFQTRPTFQLIEVIG